MDENQGGPSSSSDHIRSDNGLSKCCGPRQLPIKRTLAHQLWQFGQGDTGPGFAGCGWHGPAYPSIWKAAVWVDGRPAIAQRTSRAFGSLSAFPTGAPWMRFRQMRQAVSGGDAPDRTLADT